MKLPKPHPFTIYEPAQASLDLNYEGWPKLLSLKIHGACKTSYIYNFMSWPKKVYIWIIIAGWSYSFLWFMVLPKLMKFTFLWAGSSQLWFESLRPAYANLSYDSLSFQNQSYFQFYDPAQAVFIWILKACLSHSLSWFMQLIRPTPSTIL